MNAEGVVLGSKGCPQLRFLVRQDKHVKAQPDDRPVHKKAEVAKKKALADDHRDDCNVYGISDVTIEAADHKVTRRKNGCRRAQALKREPGKGVQQDGDACDDEEGSCGAKKGKIHQGRLTAPPRDQPRHETCNSPGGNEEKQHGSQNGEECVPPVLHVFVSSTSLPVPSRRAIVIPR